MSTELRDVPPEGDTVALVDGRLQINLVVDGAAFAAAREAADQNRNVEVVVRQMLEIGGAVLLHGGGKATVDAVAAEVDRLLTALNERSERIEAVRRTRERVAAKGFGFEDLLAPLIDACFAPHEDVFEETGTTKGIANDKVGDFVVTLNPRTTGGRERRVVFEAKDRALSMQKVLGELDAAMLNRDSQAAVMVFAHAHQAPLAGRTLRVLAGNRVVAVYERDNPAEPGIALEAACQVARAMAAAEDRDDLVLDRSVLADRLERLVNAVDRAAAIQRGIRSARRGLDSAEEAYRDMREETLALLNELQDSV
jgi:hypothetical protein